MKNIFQVPSIELYHFNVASLLDIHFRAFFYEECLNTEGRKGTGLI